MNLHTAQEEIVFFIPGVRFIPFNRKTRPQSPIIIPRSNIIEYLSFQCDCGGTEYGWEFRRPMIFGGCNIVDHYYCKKCGTHFNDPEQYTKARATIKRE